MPHTETEKEEVATNFGEVSKFPGVLGCIDGTAIHIKTPTHKLKSTYTNRHDVPSITLQAICDSQKRFINVFTGIPGKVHDACVFRMSDISAQLLIIIMW